MLSNSTRCHWAISDSDSVYNSKFTFYDLLPEISILVKQFVYNRQFCFRMFHKK